MMSMLTIGDSIPLALIMIAYHKSTEKCLMIKARSVFMLFIVM